MHSHSLELRSRPRAHGGDEHLRRGWLVAEGAGRPDRVVGVPTAFDDDLRLGERVEDFAVEKLVAQPRVERFGEAILPRLPGAM
jgi:hypothetical protein